MFWLIVHTWRSIAWLTRIYLLAGPTRARNFFLQGIKKIASFLNEFGALRLTRRTVHPLLSCHCSCLVAHALADAVGALLTYDLPPPQTTIQTTPRRPRRLYQRVCTDLSTRFKLAKLNEKVTSLERSLDHIEAKVSRTRVSSTLVTQVLFCTFVR